MLARVEQSHDTARFTAEEQAEIAARLDEIEAKVDSTLALTAEQREDVRQRFSEMKDASKRIGKKDWVLLMYGAAFSWMLSGLPPSHVETVLGMIVHAVGSIFGTPGPPPALPM